MTTEQHFQRAKAILDNFNQLDETLQDKLLNGVKCLAFLQRLAETKEDPDADSKAPVT